MKESACLLLSSTPLLPPGALHVGPLLVRLRHDSEGWAMPWMKADYQAHAGILIMHETACLNNLSSFPSPIEACRLGTWDWDQMALRSECDCPLYLTSFLLIRVGDAQSMGDNHHCSNSQIIFITLAHWNFSLPFRTQKKLKEQDKINNKIN